jgi:N-acyl-D-amino-acid deacylase
MHAGRVSRTKLNRLRHLPVSEPAERVIRSGTIIDGRGGEIAEAELSVVGGKIFAITFKTPRGVEELDACGKIVTSGFFELHIHS